MSEIKERLDELEERLRINEELAQMTDTNARQMIYDLMLIAKVAQDRIFALEKTVSAWQNSD